VPVAGEERYDVKRLFTASCIALVVIGLTFSIRADIIGALGSHFNLSNEQLGWMAGAAFWGYTACIFIGGHLCDMLGIRRLMLLGCAGHIAGILGTIFAVGFWSLWSATLLIGVANALLEAGINPLVATIYPERKTEKLNAVHSWFPWGIVAGGVGAFLLTQLSVGWQWKMAVGLAPTACYGFLCLGQRFPVTERVQRGISTAGMYRATLRPVFIIWVLCMFLTASTELGPNQWIPNILTATAHIPGILILVWINGLMAVGRMVAGPVVHRLSPIGLLCSAAILAAIGLYGVSVAVSVGSVVIAATVFAIGCCYFWPTMLGVAAERFPDAGAWGLAVIGGAGNLSVALILPGMGRIYDTNGPQMALRAVVLLPAALVVIFSVFWIAERYSRPRPSAALGRGTTAV
jgi:MFS family permease